MTAGEAQWIRISYSQAGFETVIASASEAIHSAAKQAWIASSRSLSSGAHSRDPLAPLRKRFAFVAGNDGGTHLRDLAARFARVLPSTSRPLQSEGAGNAGRPMRALPRVQ
jgi:hypothetical protein